MRPVLPLPAASARTEVRLGGARVNLKHLESPQLPFLT